MLKIILEAKTARPRIAEILIAPSAPKISEILELLAFPNDFKISEILESLGSPQEAF